MLAENITRTGQSGISPHNRALSRVSEQSVLNCSQRGQGRLVPSVTGDTRMDFHLDRGRSTLLREIQRESNTHTRAPTEGGSR